METNEEDDLVARKPSKQRRTSRNQATVRPCLTQDGDKEPNHPNDILHDLLGDSPISIRLYSNRQNHVEHALRCFQNMLETLQEINAEEGTRSFDKIHWKEIHGFLVLQLGSIDHRNSSSDQNSGSTMSLVTYLCRCLGEVYRLSMHCDMYSNGELQVAFAIIVDHVSSMSSIFAKSDTNSDNETLDSITMNSIAYILELLRMMLKHHDLEPKLVEKITTLLVSLHCDCSTEIESTLKHSASGLMQDLANSADEGVVRAANISQSVIKMLHEESFNSSGTIPNPSCNSSHSYQTESLMYLGCLANSRNGANELSKSLNLLDALVKWAIQPANQENYKKDFSYKAARSLAAVSIHRSKHHSVKDDGEGMTQSEPDWTMDALLKVLTGTSDLNIKSCVIPGLLCCQPETIPWKNAGFLQKVLSCLSMVATFKSRVPRGDHNDDNRHGAAKILFDVIEPTMSLPSTRGSTLSYTNAMAYVNMFLKADSDPSLQHLAVTTMIRANQRNAARVALHCPSVLNNLGALTCSSTASFQFKRISVGFFEAVSRTDRKAASILARQPKVLEALVSVAAAPPPGNHERNSPTPKQVALVVLMRLSEDVCNRRILAKHVGVLACMIRYARSLSNDQGQVQDHPQTRISLSDLKQNIMDLAMAI